MIQKWISNRDAMNAKVKYPTKWMIMNKWDKMIYMYIVLFG